MIVDDEEAARYGMRRALTTFGYNISEAGSAEAARALMKQQEPDLLLLDVNLPGLSGLEFLREIKELNGAGPLVIIVTAHGSERMAVEAVKAGAYDYLSKPFELDDLRLVVKNAAETVQLRRENYSLRRRIEVERSQRGALIGNSESMQRVRGMIEKVAETDATVLVRGESGTGKELVAREIHERNSARRNGSFVAVNCAALPSELIESELFGHEKGAFTGAAGRREGKFEQADGGTLFLDEIGDMSANVQAKLLRALEERRIERLGGNESIPVDVRIVSATHRPLEQEINNGNFRADLFYRLRVVTIDIPPLRERTADVAALCELFLTQTARELKLAKRRLSAQALSRLQAYEFPGNIRELRNLIERAVILSPGEEIGAEHFPLRAGASVSTAGGENGREGQMSFGWIENLPSSFDLRTFLSTVEKSLIERTLQSTRGAQAEAARRLGLSRSDLSYKLLEYELRKETPVS